MGLQSPISLVYNMERLYKKYYEEICNKISAELNIPVYKVKRALSYTFEFYRMKIWEDKFDKAIKIIGIGKFIPTILSKKKKGIIPVKNKRNKDEINIDNNKE